MSKRITEASIARSMKSVTARQAERAESLAQQSEQAREANDTTTSAKLKRVSHNVTARLARAEKWSNLSSEQRAFMVANVQSEEAAAFVADPSSIYAWDTVVSIADAARTGSMPKQCVRDFVESFKGCTVDRVQVLGKLRRNDGALLGPASQNTWVRNVSAALWVLGACTQHGPRGAIQYTIDPQSPVLLKLREHNVIKSLPAAK